MFSFLSFRDGEDALWIPPTEPSIAVAAIDNGTQYVRFKCDYSCWFYPFNLFSTLSAFSIRPCLPFQTPRWVARLSLPLGLVALRQNAFLQWNQRISFASHFGYEFRPGEKTMSYCLCCPLECLPHSVNTYFVGDLWWAFRAVQHRQRIRQGCLWKANERHEGPGNF